MLTRILPIVTLALAACATSDETLALRVENERLRAEVQALRQQQENAAGAAVEHVDDLLAKPRRPADGRTYTVQNRGSLSSIAEHIYGDPTMWEEIHAANRDVIGDDPARLTVGMTLKLPRVR